jgi:DNA modification methylase
MELVSLELESLNELDFDLDLTGFSIDDILPEETEGLTDEDSVPEVPEEPVSKKGDVWVLGNHRLMCGDSTSIDAVELLMGGVKADMVFTDPPYALFGNSTGVAGVADDNMVRSFFRDVFVAMKTHSKLFAHFYVCCDWHSAFAIEGVSRQVEIKPKNLIIWDKGDGGVGAMYQHCYEMVWFFDNSPTSKTTMPNTKAGVRTVNGVPNIWRVSRHTSSDRVHNAQKPIELVEIAVENGSDSKSNVLDLFGGSGTTLIACEKTNRNAYLMELDPKYCDVIVNRWQEYAGKQATHADTGAEFNSMQTKEIHNARA